MMIRKIVANAPFVVLALLSSLSGARYARENARYAVEPARRDAAAEGDTGISGGKIPLRYPVVLVHGISVHDRKGVFGFWGRIPEVLRGAGIPVYFGNTDAWGGSESNALILKETVEKVMRETGAPKVNLIAHSKGGLDCRFLISRHDFGDRVASLTTISTPHRGAELADEVASWKILYTPPVRALVERFGRLSGDAVPDLYQMMRDVTTENMRRFNEETPPDPRVYFQSLYTVMNKPEDDWLFHATYAYISKNRGPNDGVVSEWSACWGENARKIRSEGISHRDILDMRKRRISGVDIPELYRDMVRDLSLRGF
jgi:triacylglycerol lipase